MFRKLFCSLCALFIITGIILAVEAKGKLKKYEKGTLTLTVGDKDTEFKLGKDYKLFDGDTEVTGKDKGKLLKGLKEGADVTVSYDKDGDKVNVKEVKVKK